MTKLHDYQQAAMDKLRKAIVHGSRCSSCGEFIADLGTGLSTHKGCGGTWEATDEVFSQEKDKGPFQALGRGLRTGSPGAQIIDHLDCLERLSLPRGLGDSPDKEDNS